MICRPVGEGFPTVEPPHAVSKTVHGKPAGFRVAQPGAGADRAKLPALFVRGAFTNLDYLHRKT